MALYDPNEFPETKVGADFTLADVLAWARTKPAYKAYEYTSCTNCAISQFLRETGRARRPQVGPDGWCDRATDAPDRHPLDELLDGAANGKDVGLPNTFGAFAKRLESALA